MSKIKTVREIHDHDSAIKWAEKRNATITEATNHTKVSGPNGSTFLPRHKGEFKTGTRFAIIKQYIAIGLGVVSLIVLAIACL